MKPRHHVSRRAIELIKRFEGYRRTAARLPDGRWTIGYGHVKTAREGAEVSQDDAEALLIYDLMAVTRAVNDWTFTPLTDNQFDALVCFAFNIGLDGFRGSSVLRRVNEGEMLKAAHALEMWRKADFEGDRIVVDALVRRRAAEKALFLRPSQGWVPAPSAVIRPQVDQDPPFPEPAQTPVSLEVSLDGAQATAERPDAMAKERAFPATVAAENLAARLQALVPDEVIEQEKPAPAMDAPKESSNGKLDAEELGLARLVEPNEDRLVLQEPPAAPVFVAPAPKILQDHITFQPIDARGSDKAVSGQDGLRRIIGLGATGLACLFFAIAWSLFAAPGDGVLNSSFVSTIAGLIGIGCVVGAVYFLLVRLGGAEE